MSVRTEKLPSGSYRVRKTVNGKTYTKTFKDKPSQFMLNQFENECLQNARIDSIFTLKKACQKYIASKEAILSPATIKGYKSVTDCLPERFASIPLGSLEQSDLNEWVNEMSGNGNSPKTIRNAHGFIASVLGVYKPQLIIRTTLPKNFKEEPYTPSDEDVKRILESAQGTKYEVLLILACYGMRRSEILALTPEDIDGDIVHINKAKVIDRDNKWHTKSTKTVASTRDIVIPQKIADKIKEQGYVYVGSDSAINKFLKKTQAELEIPHFSLHKLRHYFASKMSALGIPEADILKMGGWESDHVMKSVYRHSTLERDNSAKREASAKIAKDILS